MLLGDQNKMTWDDPPLSALNFVLEELMPSPVPVHSFASTSGAIPLFVLLVQVRTKRTGKFAGTASA